MIDNFSNISSRQLIQEIVHLFHNIWQAKKFESGIKEQGKRSIKYTYLIFLLLLIYYEDLKNF